MQLRKNECVILHRQKWSPTLEQNVIDSCVQCMRKTKIFVPNRENNKENVISTFSTNPNKFCIIEYYIRSVSTK